MRYKKGEMWIDEDFPTLTFEVSKIHTDYTMDVIVHEEGYRSFRIKFDAVGCCKYKAEGKPRMMLRDLKEKSRLPNLSLVKGGKR